MRFALLLVLVGCYSAPDYDDTRFKCDAEHGCPDGQLCINGFCMAMSGSADGGPRDSSSTTDVAPGGSGVVCGSAICTTQQKCCADFVNGPSCVALGAGCSGYEATCDGTEDCTGAPCCDVGGGNVQCQATCSTQQICREDADCTSANMSKCCYGTGANEPWGRCWNACP